MSDTTDFINVIDLSLVIPRMRFVLADALLPLESGGSLPVTFLIDIPNGTRPDLSGPHRVRRSGEHFRPESHRQAHPHRRVRGRRSRFFQIAALASCRLTPRWAWTRSRSEVARGKRSAGSCESEPGQCRYAERDHRGDRPSCDIGNGPSDSRQSHLLRPPVSQRSASEIRRGSW